MAIGVLQHVNPGDIIASDLVNHLIDTLLDLEQRLAKLEAVTPSGPIVISSFEPPVQQAVGQVLVIHGSGFLFPAEQNVVRIDGVQVTAFRPGSTSIRLEFLVPPLPNVPAGGRNVVVSVQNSTGGPVERLYRVTPAVPVAGNPPTITGITRTDNTAAPLTPGGEAFINGTNFSTTPAEDVVVMRFTTLVNGLPTTITLPRQGDPPIAVTQAAANQLRVTLPLMPELPLNQNVPLNVQVTVGAHPPASGSTQVRRT